MRILIIANDDGGLYCFRKMLLEQLLNHDEVYIAVPQGKFVKDLVAMGCNFINTDIDRRGINPIIDFKLFLYYKNIITLIKPDLVMTYTIKPNIYGCLAARLAGIPYIVNITGLGTAFQNNNWIRKLCVFLYKLSLKNARAVLFENKENLQIFIDESIISKSQSKLLNGAGVDTEYFCLQEYPKDELTKFLFVGRIMREKGVNELFEVMDKLYSEGTKLELHVLGEYEEDYRCIIDKYTKVGWLKYHGFQKDVRPFIAECHCFVLPSWHEGMANTNLECAASGRPVITSNIHGCMEAVDDGISGFLVRRKDSKDLYNVMNKFLDLSYEDRVLMGKLGREKMKSEFDKRIVVADTMRILKEIENE